MCKEQDPVYNELLCFALRASVGWAVDGGGGGRDQVVRSRCPYSSAANGKRTDGRLGGGLLLSIVLLAGDRGQGAVSRAVTVTPAIPDVHPIAFQSRCEWPRIAHE
jgi:hypothetical protein